MAELHRECCECGMPLSVPTKRPCRCDSCCVSDRYEKQMGAKDAEIAQLRADLARVTAELDETRDLLIAQAEGCISFAWTDDVDGRNYRSDVPYFAAQVAVPLRDFFRALREWTATNAIRIRLAEVELALNEAIEDRRQARDDAARAAAMLAVRTMERDACAPLASLPTEFVAGEWIMSGSAEPDAVVTYARVPSPETGHVGWCWWARGKMGDARDYVAAREAAEKALRAHAEKVKP